LLLDQVVTATCNLLCGHDGALGAYRLATLLGSLGAAQDGPYEGAVTVVVTSSLQQWVGTHASNQSMHVGIELVSE